MLPASRRRRRTAVVVMLLALAAPVPSLAAGPRQALVDHRIQKFTTDGRFLGK